MSIFDTVVFPKHKRNLFNLSHERRTSAAFGQLIPIMCQEVLPGDTFQLSTSLFVRAMPMLAPLMHRVNIYTHFFFVPNRLVWDNWKTFITGGEDGTEEPVFPKVSLTYTSMDEFNGSLADHLGVGFNPITGANSFTVNALPFRAYNLIWNEYYRDQNLQDEIEISKEDGLDTTTPLGIRIRNWEKDYFTSSLPWTQRGPESTLPIAGEANVFLDSNGGLGRQIVRTALTPNEPYETSTLGTSTSDGFLQDRESGFSVLLDPNGTLKTDLSDATAVTINELRRSIALQRWMENNAIGGSRYIEQIFAHFGVKSSDARLQRPEFLGGSRQPLQISEVLQTSASTDSSDLGDMAGHGVSSASSKQFRRYFEEHGFIIGIMSIMPKSSYQDGTQRLFRKYDKFDYAFPEFANLGEQPVYMSEIFQTSDNFANSDGSKINDNVFGYQSRYSEYKYVPNTVHGDLRSDAFSPWTLVRKFHMPPTLNSQFITADWSEEDLSRIFPITDSETQFIVQLYNKVKAVRLLPKFVIPSI